MTGAAYSPPPPEAASGDPWWMLLLSCALLILIVVVSSPIYVVTELNHLIMSAINGHSDGEGLTALPYILSGRHDLIGDFVVSLAFLVLGTMEWGFVGRWVSVWLRG